jgi:heme oxygenase
MRCQSIGAKLNGMINPNQHEMKALAAASQASGSFVEQLGKTDLSAWSEQEWVSFIDTTVTAFQDTLNALYNNDPLSKEPYDTP